jgi:predicted RNA binding protein YcfA (HicA-like mRNA interferase family)
MPLKFREILMLLEADGWVMVAQQGSHRQYKHPTKPRRVTVPGKPAMTGILSWKEYVEASHIERK